MTSTSQVTGKVQPDLRTDSQIPTGLNDREKEVYETLLEVKKQRTKLPPDVFVITDIAKDYDDLVAMILLKELHRLGLIRLKGFIANLFPAEKRAAYGRGVLDSLGLHDVPIAWGQDATTELHPDPGYEFEYPFKPKNCTSTRRKENPEDLLAIEAGFWLLEQCVLDHSIEEEKREKGGKQQCNPNGLTFLLISSLADIDSYIKNFKEQFVMGTARVVLQGNYNIEGHGHDTVSLAIDEAAMNNKCDPPAARHFHHFIAEREIPSIVYTKIAASAAGMAPKFFKDLRDTGHVLGEHLLDRQVKQELEFYKSSQLPDPPHGKDQENYLNVRTTWYDSHNPEDKKPKDGKDIIPYVKIVLYDVLAAFDTAGEDVINALGVLTPFRDYDGDSSPSRKELTARHRVVGKEVPGEFDSQGKPAVDTGIDVAKMQLALTALLKGSLQSAVEQGFGLKENYV